MSNCGQLILFSQRIILIYTVLLPEEEEVEFGVVIWSRC